MNEKTKHRIVGITVIVTLLTLVIPLMQRKTDPILVEMSQNTFSPIKPSGKISYDETYGKENISFDERLIISENKSISKKNGAKQSAIKPDSPRKQVLDNNQSTTWIIQLASFANDNNAHNLVDVLRKQGYNAYAQSVVNTNYSALTRVLIGPQIRHQHAEELVSQLANRFGLDGIIIKNNPLGN